MRLNNKRAIRAGGAAMLLALCAGAGAAPPGQTGMAIDHPVRIGPPYQIGGTTYTPEDTADYDEVGYAGRQEDAAFDGEPFVPSAITAAHRTLPVPSYVEVTALDTGRTILVRVNARGPMANDRIIDLSPGAAAQLGLSGEGPAGVRVRRVNPPEQERAVLRAHGRAAERLESPEPLLVVLRKKLGSRPATVAATPSARPARTPPPAPKAGASFTPPPVAREPAAPTATPPGRGGFIVEEAGAPRPAATPPPATPAPAPTAARPSSGGYVVQVAAFRSRANAERLARMIGASAVEGGGLWRVRYGPYPTRQGAQAGVRQAAAKGFENAHITANDPR